MTYIAVDGVCLQVIARVRFKKERGEGRKILEIIDYARKDSLYP